jgi:hypothetical protein
MKFNPDQKYTLYSPLSLSDSKRRLQEHLDSPKKWFYLRYDSKSYDGEIEGDDFTIFQVGSLHIPKWPDITGRFSTANGGTAIDVRIRLPKLAFTLGGCAIAFLLICFVGSAWSDWSTTHSLRGSWMLASFLFGCLFLFYVAITVNILLLAAQSKKFLTKLFEAE